MAVSRLLAAVLYCLVLVNADSSSPPSEFDCVGLGVGDHPIADGACSHHFFKCGEGAMHGVLFNCTSTLAFDRESGSCLHRMYIADCGGHPTEQTPTSTAAPTEAPFQFSCDGRRDGHYADSERPCSGDYVSCVGGIAHFRSCSAGLAFDIISTECLAPESVKLCGGDVTTRSPEDTSTHAPETGFDCAGLPDGLYPPTDEPCSNTFFSCSAERAQRLSCPGNLFYDLSSGRCVAEQHVEACGGESTEPPVITTRAPTADDQLLSCAGRAPGTYEDPSEHVASEHGVCSSLFIVCTGAPFALLHRCQDGLVFDSSRLRCEHPDRTPGCTGVEHPVVVTTPPPQGRPAPLGFCATRAAGNYELEEGECSDLYVACAASGRGIIAECASGLYYDAEFDQCDFSEFIPVCSGNERPVRTTTEANQQAPVDPALSAFCASRPDGNHPLSAVCSSSYVACTGGRPDVFHCPGETKYSANDDACLDAASVEGCEEFASGENECLGRVNGFYPIAGQCGSYIFCSNEEAFGPFPCPDGHVFNPRNQRCQSSTEEPLGGTCGLPELPPFDCTGLEVGFYTFPDDCQNYYYCEEDNSAWAFSCEPGFAFDTEISQCVPETQLAQCLPERAEPVLQNFCLAREIDAVFQNPLKCDEGVICLKGTAFDVECNEQEPFFDGFLLRCVETITAAAACVPEGSRVFVDELP